MTSQHRREDEKENEDNLEANENNLEANEDNLEANEDNLESMNSTPAHCLKLPGKKLDLTALLYAKQFRNHGYKKGSSFCIL